MQDAYWVSAGMAGRENCGSCGGTSASLKWQVGLVACGAAIKAGKAALAAHLATKLAAITGMTYWTSELVVNGGQALFTAMAGANVTKGDLSFLLNITDPSFTTPIAPIKLSGAAASNTTLLRRIGDIAVVLDSFTTAVTGGTNATMQELVDGVALTVAKAVAATAENHVGLKAMLNTAQALQNITTLATTGGGDAVQGALGDAAVGVSTQALVQGLVTNVAAALDGVARALLGDTVTDVAQALTPNATEALAWSKL